MDLVEVDRLHLQAPEAGLAFAEDGLALQAPADLALFVPDAGTLGEEQGLGGEILDGAAHHFLGMAKTVDRGGIDPVHSEVERRVNGRDGIGVVLRPPGELPIAAPHGPRADAQRGDVEIAIA